MMVFRLICLCVALLFTPSGAETELYKILSLSPDGVIIGGERKTKGDTFRSTEAIQWTDDDQTMRVLDVETENMFLLCAKMQDVSTEHTGATYGGLVSALSTNIGKISEQKKKGGYYFLTYMDKTDAIRSVKIEAGMFLNEYPDSLSLYFYDNETSESELMTDDMRRFVDDLIITDQMVKRHMGGLDYYKGDEAVMVADYMTMMRVYVSDSFRKIDYTYDDLKIFLTLKY